MDTRVIVVVEDNEAIARLVQEVLNDVPGYGAVTVPNGAVALDVIAAVRADLVILDVDLPGLGGFEIFDHLRALPHTANTPVLFMSATSHSNELSQRGVRYYIGKPFDLDDLLGKVNLIFAQPVANSS